MGIRNPEVLSCSGCAAAQYSGDYSELFLLIDPRKIVV